LRAIAHSHVVNRIRTRFCEWLVVLPALAVFAVPRFAEAHGDLHEKIAHISQLLRAAPNDAELYVQRGRVHLDDANLRQAERDFRKARRLDPAHSGALYFLGEAQLKALNLRDAERTALAFLAELEPGELTGQYLGQRLLARVHSSAKRPAKVAAAYRSALLAQAGEPDDHLAYAQALEASGNHAAALAALDHAIQTLGNQPAFWERSIQLELARNNPQGALQRFDAWISTLPQPALQLKQKADLLVKLTQPDEAKLTYERALAQLRQLPPARRSAPALLQLETELEAALSALAKR
jgi:predicted Zn-dependent protease